jgi:hypothetical protein
MKSEGLEEAQDRLGGYQSYETDIYPGKVKLAYAGQAPSGARFMYFSFVLADGKEYRETVYFTNKAGENWFPNKQDASKKVPLPGFTLVNDICLATTGQELSVQAAEDKVVNVYDPEQKKELPKSVPVLVDLLGKDITLAILKKIESVKVKQGNDYVATDKTRETNGIDKVFHTESGMTVKELKDKKTEASFQAAWLEKNKGKTRDLTQSEGKSGRPGSAGAPPAAGATAKPRTSLFSGG